MNEFPGFLQDNQECTQGFPACCARNLQAQGIGSASSLESLGWVGDVGIQWELLKKPQNTSHPSPF